MTWNNRFAIYVSLSSCLAAAGPFRAANPQEPNQIDNQIEVRISPATKTVTVGEQLEVRVEIRNIGNQQLLIDKNVFEWCDASPLSLYLELGPPLKPSVGTGCAADCFWKPGESLANRVVESWIPLPVGHFYGATVRMDQSFFPQLQTPGRWQLRGRYRSDGASSSSACLRWDPEEAAKLPYKAWKGAVDTNVVWIEVVRHRSGKLKRQ